ncbi:hypothetical protein A5719_12770 [Mycolicibacterium peregrinum]|uniref:hypothetical protein n=1 Tax=Mycolicibacterium peregrinum TaxID=43304 RepID=UPI0007E9DF6D|nr:hypothetical protein [Mycolicibacterium peregrinum]OBF41613.1 hypothetical protein A5719_12770 [Mycolicibacterium peregrinum]
MRGSEAESGGHCRKWWPATLVGIAGLVSGCWLPFPSAVELDPVSYPGRVGVPGQVLLPSLKSEPVPGWRVDLNKILSEPVRINPEFIGNDGNRAYFTVEYLVRTKGLRKTAVLGIDVSNGTTLFPPVDIPDARSADCFLNGPRRLVCVNDLLSDDRDDVWVVDSDAGAIIAHVPTGLRPQQEGARALEVKQVGNYAVALETGVGAHGIGDQGQLTWSVAGDGDLLSTFDRSRFPGDPPATVAATMNADGPETVFSVVDGAVLAENVDRQVEPVIGGYMVDERRGRGSQVFGFYDEKGTKVGEYRPPKGASAVPTGEGELPVLAINLDDAQLVLDNHGTPMSVVRTENAVADRFLGEHLFINHDLGVHGRDVVWKKFDLTTGDQVSACSGVPLGAMDFVGSDGTVVIGRFERDGALTAVDTNTCETLWQIADPPAMWAVGSTLVQLLPQSAEFTALVPPTR